MITQTSLAIASHHAVVADFVSDPKLALVEVSYSQFSISLSVDDAESLLHLYDRIKRPGRSPKVSVFDRSEDLTQFGPHVFVMVKEFYAKPELPDVEIVGSLLLTDPVDLRACRVITPGPSLLDSLVAAFVLRKETP